MQACLNGNLLPGKSSLSGQDYNNPEKNCCQCGKGRDFLERPNNAGCTHLAGNSRKQWIVSFCMTATYDTCTSYQSGCIWYGPVPQRTAANECTHRKQYGLNDKAVRECAYIFQNGNDVTRCTNNEFCTYHFMEHPTTSSNRCTHKLEYSNNSKYVTKCKNVATN